MGKSAYERYINSVINNIKCNNKTRKKIKEDLLSHIQIKSQKTGEKDPWKLMGDPHEVAIEFRENLNIKEDYRSGYYEYISETRIFGWPLVHINSRRNGFARGIIAVGGISVGIVSVGGLSIGLLSFGGLSLGLLIALGGFAGSLGVALGGSAISYYMSIGGMAIAKHFAVGAYAQANIAIGDTVKCVLGAYETKGAGDVLMKFPVDKEVFINEVKELYPRINSIIINTLKIFIR